MFLLLFKHTVICEPLSLDNGMIDCQYGSDGGPNAGDNCTLTCDDGYLINGSDIRECRNDGTWSYFDAECYESESVINDDPFAIHRFIMCVLYRWLHCYNN